MPSATAVDLVEKKTNWLATGDLLMSSSTRSKPMERDPEKEAVYWREQHSKQPYAKDYSYEQFEHAYRTGYSSFLKYPGKKFDEVEESVAADYDAEKPGSALPYDTVRPAISSVWDRMAGVIGPRDPDRGIRGAI
jgi:hypothetical protein